MPNHEQIDYLEFPASDLKTVQDFFSQVFGWRFTDYGPDYCAFSGAGIDGGFYRAELTSSSQQGAALVVFYSLDLKQTQDKILDAGGTLVRDTFEFPGGRRFHFSDPCGNEYAVWSDQPVC